MDITNEFKTSVSSVKSRKKNLDAILENNKENKWNLGKRSLNSPTSTSPLKQFNSKLGKLVETISKAKQELIKTRKDYINLYGNLLSKASPMSDEQRDQFDETMERCMRVCKDSLKQYRSEVSKQYNSLQVKEHQTAVIDLVDSYLKNVCNIYSQQKAIRVRRAVDKQKLSRLEYGIQSPSPLSQLGNSNFLNSLNTQQTEQSHETSHRSATFHHVAEQDGVKTMEAVTLTAEEMQMFEKENTQLFEEMNALTEEVKQIEGKVIEISRLQEIFTDKVLQQELDLNRVNETSVNATENVRGGNEQLREAMRKNAGFRVWILFFIITLAFTILFLDWYNP